MDVFQRKPIQITRTTLNLIIFILLFTACSSAKNPDGTQILENQANSISTNQIDGSSNPSKQFSIGQSLRFDSISLEEGLSQSTVFCMLQDNQGFMWFGTEDGLNKYDGYHFTIYKHDPEDPNSLSSNWIQAILEDDSSTLWIGTSDGGLNQYDRKLDRFIHYRNDPEDPSSLSDDEITALYLDQDGNLWIGTGSGGLDKFDQKNGKFIHYQHNADDPNSLSSNAISAIYQDQYGILWIGTEDGGLNRFELERGRWQRYVNDPSDPPSLSDNHITAISEDQSGVLWVGTDGRGLEKFDQESERFTHYQHDPGDPDTVSSDEITALSLDRDGVLWIGTRNGGANWFDEETESFIHFQNVPGDSHSLSSNLVSSIFQDREGVLWFGTIGGGVNKLNLGWRNFSLYQNDPNDPNSLSDNMIRAFYQDSQGNLWIGTSFGGLNRFDRNNNSWNHYRHDPADPSSLSSNWVSSILGDHSGTLWVGTSNGLDRFNPEKDFAAGGGTFTHYQPNPNAPIGASGNFINNIFETQNGEFWISTADALYQFDRQKESWNSTYRHNPSDPDSLSDGWVYILQEDKLGRFWIGTFGGGLNLFDPQKETFIHYQNNPGDPDSLSNNFISAIHQDQGGAIWIGTNGGLDKFDPGTETFFHYQEKDGLPNETIYCIAEDTQGYLWLSTNNGLSRFDPILETFRNYEVKDGLQSNEFNGKACLTNDNGEMFFGGIDGFNVFLPDQVQDNPILPPIVLTSFTQNGERVDLGVPVDLATEVTIEWPDNRFEFEYAALSYSQPEKNQYAYSLEGFDDSWNEVGTRRYGQYTNLQGGTYTLRVIGSNDAGIWDEQGTALRIKVVPPFWATWWFRVLSFLVVLGIIFGGYQLRVRNLEVQRKELAFQVEQRTAELLETQEALRQSELEKAITEERSRLARELHDSVTQSLHSSTLLAEAGQRLAGEGDIERARGYLVRLGEISQQALKEMRLLVYELRPLGLTGIGLGGALQQRLDAVERRSGVEVELSIDEGLVLSERAEEALFWIAMEALNNSLKHANPDTVTVTLKKVEDREFPCVELAIKDDGVGFDLDLMDDEGGLGLISMKERIEKLEGELTILSAPGEGAEVKACVKLDMPPTPPDSLEV